MNRRRLLSSLLSLPLLFAASAALQAAEITHSMGTTEVPDHPQRVVVLTNEGTEALLAVDIKPVGAVRSWLGDPWYAHIADRMEGVEVVGEESAVNLELIAALQPDLIIGNKTRQEKIYEQLSAIAPTVFAERLRGDWKINCALYTKAVGKEAEGKAVLDRYNSRVAALSEALRDQPAIETWLFVLSPSRTIVSMVNGLFPISDSDVAEITVPFTHAAGAMVIVMLICSLVMFVWYQRHD